MVDFRKLISYDSRQRVARMMSVIERFDASDPKTQARILLDTARKVYEDGAFSVEHHYSYDEALLLRVIPQIAHRLDPDIVLLDREKPGEDGPHSTPWAEKSDEDIAYYAGSCVANCSLNRADGDDYEASSCLVMSWNRGNMVKIAINSLVPGWFPLVPDNKVQDPLTGYQVVLENVKGLSVLKYKDTAEEAAEWVRTGLERIRKDPDLGISGYERLREAVLTGIVGEIGIRKWDDNDLIEIIALREPKVEECPTP